MNKNKEQESLDYVEPLLEELTREIKRLELNLFLMVSTTNEMLL